jgi:hypothetical protein
MKKYIYIVLIIFFIGAIGKSIYDQLNKKSPKATRLECQKYSTVFERVLKPKLLKEFQLNFKNGEVNVNIEIEKAKYMKSKLFEYLDANAVKNDFIKIAGLNDQGKNYPSSIDILIYENDKKDPGKKTPKSKLYAGYLIFSVKVNNSLVYKVQIDFLDEKGEDTQKVLQCAVKSIQTIQGEK